NPLVGARRAVTLGRGASLRAARLAGFALAAGFEGLADFDCLREAALSDVDLTGVDLPDVDLLDVNLLAALPRVALLAASPEAPAESALPVLRADFDVADGAFATARLPRGLAAPCP